MRYKKNYLINILSSIVLGASLLQAQSGIAPVDIERSGQSGWQFLKINGDARQAAMGGAFTAISFGDAGSVFGNPATLTDIGKINIQMNALQWIADISHQSVSLAANFENLGVVGLSFAMLDYGDIPETVNMPGGASGTTPTITGNTFSAHDYVTGISYARKITDKLSIGGNLRWMQEKIAGFSMNNWSLDFGTMYYTGFRSLRVAITARNFGPDSRFSGWSEQYQTESDNVRMPLDFRAGIAMDFLDGEDSPHLLTAVLEGDHPNDGREKFHIGFNYGFENTFFFRAGYKFNYDVQRFTFGAGINYSWGGMNATIDYAYVDFSELMQVHMFSFGFSL
ncbi:MAG: PorV/PorQ family protein [Bacteroidetes bacterium]|nr:PorV/PorQ family protein [Bacteroidota bacterium]